MLIQAIIWLAGIHITSFFSILPSVFLTLGMSAVTFLLYSLKKIQFLKYSSIFFIGFSWAIWNANSTLSWDLPKNLENKPFLADGYITSVPEKNNLGKLNKKKFYFKLKTALIQLTWQNPTLLLYPGQHYQLLVKLKRPHATLNPGGFDQEKFYFKEKIRAIGYVINSTQNKRLSGYSFLQIPNFIRQWLYEKMEIRVSHKNFMGILIALCLGIKNYITPAQWSIFQATGTNHLVAISGLHIGLAASFFYFFTQFFWKRSAYLMHLFPLQQASSMSALIGAFLYCFLAGFSIPTIRALVMISIFMLSLLYRRNMNVWRTFSIALIFSLVTDSLASLSESFWLSFGAVFFIFYVIAHRISFSKSLWNKVGKIQWAVTLGLAPLTLIFFQQTSIISFPANLIAIPWVSFLVIPTALLGMLFIPFSNTLSGLLFSLSNQLLKLIFIPLDYLSQLSFSRWYLGISRECFISIMLGTLLLLSPRGIPYRWLGLLMFLPLWLNFKPTLPKNRVSLMLLDVGQGLSAIVSTQNHTLLFDAGARFSDHFDMGKAVVLPYLLHQNIKAIDTFIISHKDNDHMGGAQSILKNFPVKHVLSSTPDYFSKKISEPCYRGQKWTWDGVIFEILYPFFGSPYTGNNSSCTLLIKTGKQGILITGDLEKSGELKLSKLEKNNLLSTILVAGHHGSRTSSHPLFIKQVNPKYVLFSSGYFNQYKFPNVVVVDRYRKQGVLMENTADVGGLYFELDPDLGVIKKIRYRELMKKYWHH